MPSFLLWHGCDARFDGPDVASHSLRWGRFFWIYYRVIKCRSLPYVTPKPAASGRVLALFFHSDLLTVAKEELALPRMTGGVADEDFPPLVTIVTFIEDRFETGYLNDNGVFR